MFTAALMEEIRLTLKKVRARRQMLDQELSQRTGFSLAHMSRTLYGNGTALTEEDGKKYAEGLGLGWDSIVAVAKQRWDHNRLYEEAIARLASASPE